MAGLFKCRKRKRQDCCQPKPCCCCSQTFTVTCVDKCSCSKSHAAAVSKAYSVLPPTQNYVNPIVPAGFLQHSNQITVPASGIYRSNETIIDGGIYRSGETVIDRGIFGPGVENGGVPQQNTIKKRPIILPPPEVAAVQPFSGASSTMSIGSGAISSSSPADAATPGAAPEISSPTTDDPPPQSDPPQSRPEIQRPMLETEDASLREMIPVSPDSEEESFVANLPAPQDRSIAASRNAMRTWGDCTSSHSARARLLACNSQNVFLMKTNGLTCKVEISRLCSDDQRYVRSCVSSDDVKETDGLFFATSARVWETLDGTTNVAHFVWTDGKNVRLVTTEKQIISLKVDELRGIDHVFLSKLSADHTPSSLSMIARRSADPPQG